MADLAKRYDDNVAGEFFVDATCIDCDTCRQLAPATFAEAGDHSYVHCQPANPSEQRLALHALLACPTGSIGTVNPNQAKNALDDFPTPLAENVFYCGFNSVKSFGGNSYFLRRPDGNWLIDSPKFLPRLAKNLQALGGVSKIFLTHRDDVADADKYARFFGAQRVIHRLELQSQPDAEIVLEGDEPTVLGAGLLAIPTVGHTAGHCVLLVDDCYLFTGDHLWWVRGENRLGASKTYCWYSWEKQIESMARLQTYRFSWVLPGHGQRVELPADQMAQQLGLLVQRMTNGNPKPNAWNRE